MYSIIFITCAAIFILLMVIGYTGKGIIIFLEKLKRFFSNIF